MNKQQREITKSEWKEGEKSERKTTFLDIYIY